MGVTPLEVRYRASLRESSLPNATGKWPNHEQQWSWDWEGKEGKLKTYSKVQLSGCCPITAFFYQLKLEIIFEASMQNGHSIACCRLVKTLGCKARCTCTCPRIKTAYMLILGSILAEGGNFLEWMPVATKKNINLMFASLAPTAASRGRLSMA